MSDSLRSIQLVGGALSGKEMVAVSLSGSEAVSELFSFVLELSANNDNIDADSILGEETAILLKAKTKECRDRYIHGHVSEFSNLGMDAGGDARYQAVIVPSLWFCGLAEKIKSHCYESMQLQEIYKVLLNDTGVNYKVLATDSSSILNYFQIQYNESDLDFMLRFLAEAGVSFFFEHSKSEHKMVLVNSATMYTTKPESLSFSNAATPYVDKETVMGWRQQYQCFTPKVEHMDYDNKGKKQIAGKAKSTTQVKPMQSVEASFYGQGFTTIDPGVSGLPSIAQGQAQDQAKSALRSKQGQHVRISAASDCVSLSAGTHFSLQDKPTGGGDKFIITRIFHRASAGIETGTDYKNEFECIPGATEIAPELSRCPRVYGSLAAKVVQTEYNEASPDRAFGMVKVAFPWAPEVKTPWLQVAQIFGSGGGDSGAWFLPQLEDDVLVSFLGGDTRRPVIVGILHNGKNKGPEFVNGDGDFTRVGIRTPIGHELSFCDSGGAKEAEEVYLESAGNFDRTVIKNETADIGIDQEISVGQKIVIDAGTSIELKVGSNRILIDSNGIKIEGMNVTAKAKVDVKIDGLNVTAKAKVNAKIEGAMSELSGQAMTTVKGGMVMIN